VSKEPKKSAANWLGLYILLGVVWGCSFIFIKLGLEFLTPYGVAFIRCALGAISLLVYARIRGIKLPRDRKVWFHLWAMAIFLNVIPGIFFALAETEVTSILAGIINAVTPLMALISIIIILPSEKPKAGQLVGILIGFTGVLIVLGVWNGFGDNPAWAIFVLLFAVAFYGLSFPYSRRFVQPYGLQPEALAATQVTLGAITLLPFFIFDGVSSTTFRPEAILAMIALGVMGSGFAYIWNFQIMEIAGSAIASSVTYLTPVVAVIVGILFLGESVSWYEPVGAVVVLLGAAIAQERISLGKRKSNR
jgi:drug/metabolite transporter (DMT)-like permease